jgi:hypothetical protein
VETPLKPDPNLKKEALMGYREKVESSIVKKAESRLAGMQLIDDKKPKPVNYGSDTEPITVAEVRTKLDQVEAIRVEYNKTLKMANEIGNKYAVAESELNKMCSKILSSAFSLFDENSDEYEKLGGTRTSDRKRPVRTKKETK